jgi:site-specific recombinase XerD
VRIKRDYLAFLGEAKRMSERSIDQVAAALSQFEASTGYKDFRLFNVDQARRFKRMLNEDKSQDTGKVLAKATLHTRLMALKAFFQWLARQPGYRSKIRYPDTEYYNPTANDSRIATATRERAVPSIEQLPHVVFFMPKAADIDKRNVTGASTPPFRADRFPR